MFADDKNMKTLIALFDKYKINNDGKRELYNIIKPIFMHPEFQNRFGNDFMHHGDISISEHVIEDAIKTYLLSKIYMLKKNDKKFDIKTAVIIAMLHDLYTIPWQNNLQAKVKKYNNAHGFRHPVEAVINSYCWYPELFYDDEITDKIVDGIVHHMYPLPVIVIDNSNYNKWELRNYDLFLGLPEKIKDKLIDTTSRGRIGCFSISRSKYMEGRIMSKADKYVSIRQLKSIYDMTALVTGKNRGLKK